MSAATAAYGRTGTQAGGDPRVTEILQRSVEGQYQAAAAFETTLASLRSRGLILWTAPVGELTLLNAQWLTLIAWEQATVYLDAMVGQDGQLSDAAYHQADQLCDQAADASMRMIGMQSAAGQGKRPPNARLSPYQPPSGNRDNVVALWAVVEAIYIRVLLDMQAVKDAGTPARMQKVYRLLQAVFEPKAEIYRFLQKQWRQAASGNQVQLIRQVLPLAQVFFEVGQQLWTPYLAGPAYIDIVRTKPMFDKLGLSFDPWLLTDPMQVDNRVTDLESCKQLIQFWQTVDDADAVQAVQETINLAIEAEDVTIVPGRTFKIAPWHPYYSANRELTIGSQPIKPGQTFTLYPRTVAGKRQFEIRVSG